MEALPTNKFIQAVSADLGIDQANSFPWLPLPDEQANDYMAFDIWCKMGTSRPAQTHRLAKQNKWAARALAWDEYMVGQTATVKDMADAASKAIMQGIGQTVHAMQLELVKVLRNMGSTQTSSMTLPEIVSSLEKVAKTARLLSDKSTENVALVGRVDLTNLSDAELEMAEQLRNKALGVDNGEG